MTDSVRILIVDDDAEMCRLLMKRLAEYGFDAASAESGQAMFAELASRQYDLILLDIMMPGEDGLALCRRLRAPGGAHAAIPVIFMTALGETSDRIVGLELGGDDYLVKPFEIREMIARIRAVLRRTCGASQFQAASLSAQPVQSPNLSSAAGAGQAIILRFGKWRLNVLARHLVDEQGVAVPLSAVEFRLLALFLERPQQVLTRDQIMEHTAGRTADVFDRSVDVQVNRLRSKLKDTGKNPEIIRTMRGDGYMFALPVFRLSSEAGTS